MALFIAKRRKEFNEGPLLILSIDGGTVRRRRGGGGSSTQWLVKLQCVQSQRAADAPRCNTLQSSTV